MIPKGYLPISTAEGRMFFFSDKRGRLDYEITAGNLPVYYFNDERGELIALLPAQWKKADKNRAFENGSIYLDKGKQITLVVEQSKFEELLSAEIAYSETVKRGFKPEPAPDANSEPAAEAWFEATRGGSTGRTPEYVWDKIWAETVYYIDQNGLPKDKETLIRIIQELCRDKLKLKKKRRNGSEVDFFPSRSTLQPKVMAIFAVFKREENARG